MLPSRTCVHHDRRETGDHAVLSEREFLLVVLLERRKSQSQQPRDRFLGRPINVAPSRAIYSRIHTERSVCSSLLKARLSAST